jgi:signal transduction histidine kinase
MNKRIQNTIIVLISLVVLGIFIGTVISLRLDNQRVKSLLEKEKSEGTVLIDQVIEAKSSVLKGFTYDYTFWDEMVDCIKNRDRQWADENILVALENYHLDYAWVYTMGLDTVYVSNPNGNQSFPEIPINKSDLIRLINTGGKTFYFFVKSGANIIQISGATVHPSSDAVRQTPAQGYFFAAKLWKPEYLNEFRQFVKSDLKVVDLVNGEVPADTLDTKNYMVSVYRPLMGWDNKPVAALECIEKIGIAEKFDESSKKRLFILMLYMIVGLIITSTILIGMIHRPIRLLVTSLSKDDPQPIQKLMRNQNEFGQIADLINRFFKQKQQLVDEIKVRISTEEELTQARDKAEESDRLKTAFLNNISHEIRTPMNAIVGFSELIEDPRISEKERLEFTGIIRDSSYRLLAVITDLINLSSLESGQEVIFEEPISLNTTLRDIYKAIKSQTNEKNLELGLDEALKDEHSMVYTDKTKLMQVMTNLLNNSVKFTSKGKIDFGYSIRSGEIEFFIKDTGIGIPPEKHEMIFARFQQADDTHSRHFGGAGMGLPIAKAYVELMGGKIWLKSEVGQGTQFYFTIPYKPV